MVATAEEVAGRTGVVAADFTGEAVVGSMVVAAVSTAVEVEADFTAVASREEAVSGETLAPVFVVAMAAEASAVALADFAVDLEQAISE